MHNSKSKTVFSAVLKVSLLSLVNGENAFWATGGFFVAIQRVVIRKTGSGCRAER